MVYPGYLLNPGDLFQVKPERVLFATGAPKDKDDRKAARAAKKSAAKAEEAEGEGEQENTVEETTVEKEEEPLDPKQALKSLLSSAKGILNGTTALPAKRKQDFRAFQKAVRRVLSRSSSSTILTESLEAQFLELKNQLGISKAQKKEEESKAEKEPSKAPAQSTKAAQTSEATAKSNKPSRNSNDTLLPEKELLQLLSRAARDPKAEIPDDGSLSDVDLAVLQHALANLRDNPIDPKKPYATPWRPRDYMSAFAFIPRYLEVNQNVCAAVYLRHPVARQGLAEVPSPIDTPTATLAYNWYLRRR